MEANLKGANVKKIEGTGGAIHQYSQDEVRGYVNLINSYLKDDDLCSKKLPINPDNDDLFGKLSDGFIFAKLINRAASGTIDMRAMNTKVPLNVFQIKENLNLVIQSSKAIGCKIVSIFPETILEKREYIILGMLWQILKLCVLATINIQQNPYLARLLGEDENLEDFRNLPPENALLRWFNFHLENAKHNRRVHNFTTDLQDGINYTILLNQLDPQKCDLSGLKDDEATRASKIITNAINIGVEAVIRPTDITNAHPRLNLLFTSLIYTHHHGLESQDPKLRELFESARMLEENADAGDTREERAFRMWTNSLDLTDGKDEPFYMNNLYDDVNDGVILLKIFERIASEDVVDWKKATLNPNIKFKKVENCNQVIDIGKKLGFTLVGIGGADLVNKNKKLILAVYWQMMRKDTLKTIGNMSEEDLLKWANSRVKDVPALKSFHDPSIRNCKFIFSLLNSIEPRAINWEHVTPGENDEQIENNAKYALSVARRIGATIFSVWEDIRDVKPKMIMTILAALKRIAEGDIPRKKSGDEMARKKGSEDLSHTTTNPAQQKTIGTKSTATIPSAKPDNIFLKSGEGGSVKPSDLLKGNTTPSNKPVETTSTKPTTLFSSKPSENTSVKPSALFGNKASEGTSVKPSDVFSAKPKESEPTNVKPSNMFVSKPAETTSVKPSNIFTGGNNQIKPTETLNKPEETSNKSSNSWMNKPKDTSEEIVTQKPVQVDSTKSYTFSSNTNRPKKGLYDDDEEEEDDFSTKASDFFKEKEKPQEPTKKKLDMTEAHTIDSKSNVSSSIKTKSALFR